MSYYSMQYSASAALRGQKQRSLATGMCLPHSAVAKQILCSVWVCVVLSCILSDPDTQNETIPHQRAGLKQSKAIFRSVVLAD